MATRFRSAAQRGFWLGILIATAVDAVVAYLIASFFADNVLQAVGIALLIVVGVYIFQMLYGLLALARGVVIFFLYEREKRTVATLEQMVRVGMPRPDEFYGDPTEYLSEVAQSDDVSNDAKLFAGATLGSLETLRNTNHSFMAMSLLMVLEGAIGRYGRGFKPRSTEGEEDIHIDDFDLTAELKRLDDLASR
jgi:uncharacterized protein YjeT (DUF2065 family)